MQLPRSAGWLGWRRVDPRMVCEACALPYCFEHATQHGPQEPCVDFVRRATADERASRDFMRRTLKCKPCPECGLATEKNRGCAAPCL